MAKAGSVFSANDVVLTGVSGRMPESNTIEEFAENLYAGVDLITRDDRRWPQGVYGIYERNGKLKDLSSFDAAFFGVHPKQAHTMDPMLRMMLEVTYEAIVDAGINPAELRGSRTGVFVGVSYSESYPVWCTVDPDKINGYLPTGCCYAMLANRVSYTFDLKGPSYSLDTACASSMYALVVAVEAIREGRCDAAIVGGTNLCLDPMTSLHFHRLTTLSPEGRSAAFDASANGYVRSEGVVAVLLQRRGAARRVYATVRGAGLSNDGYKEQGITYPCGDMQRKLAQEIFQVAGLRPQDVAYLEAHGTGTKTGDPQEANAIAELFCKDRQTPLLVGSVKSNMGHAEAAAALCSIAKMVIAIQRGVIPGNLNYKSPNPLVPALSDGRIQVVSRNTPWDGGLIAMNSFGLGGANSHVILESEPSSPVTTAATESGLPRLVLASGRTEEAVRVMLRHAQTNLNSAALHALMDAVHALPIPGHPYRGYSLLSDPPQEEILEMEDGGSSEARPVWFMFSGMGSQWPGMAHSLMALPVFAASIARSAEVLKPFGMDLLHVLTDIDEKIFDDVINTFVCIVAVQVALVDVLQEVSIKPDGIIGISLGEIGCAYADGALTAEQAILCAYWRGRCVLDAKLSPGDMYAVGLSWEQAKKTCPPDVELACHLDNDSVTVSGPLQSVEKFAAELTAENILARPVSCCGVAFHSTHVAAAAPSLLTHLKKEIPNPKPRSARWLTTSVSIEQRDTQVGQLCSAEYFVNNLVSPVRLARVLRDIPAHAAVVELAPHAMFTGLLRRAMPRAANVPLLRRHAADAASHLLAALGKLFAAGCQPRVGRLYPPVPFPVPRGTPGLASYVRWDRSQQWSVVKIDGTLPSTENFIECDLSRDEDAFIAGHDIDGRILYPATGYLTLVWRTMAKLHKMKLEETCIVLENVQFKRATIVLREVPVRFLVTILEGSGEFEVCEGGSVVVNGVVRLAGERSTERLAPEDLPPPLEPTDADANHLPLNKIDIYKEFNLRGYNYSGVFCGICASNPYGTAGQLTWEGNWVSFMDTMLQFLMISVDTRELYLPKRLQRVVIDPIVQAEALAMTGRSLPVQIYKDIDVVIAGGVEMRGIKTSLAPRRQKIQEAPKLDKNVFVPYDNFSDSREETSDSHRVALAVCLQLAMENKGSPQVKIVEVAQGRTPESLLLPLAMQLLESEPLVHVNPILMSTDSGTAKYATVQEMGVKVTQKETGCHLVMGEDVMSGGTRSLQALAGALAARGMLLLRERREALDLRAAAAAGLTLLSRQVAENYEYLLLGRKTMVPKASLVLELTGSSEYAWLPRLQAAMQQSNASDSRIYLWSREQDSGILGLANCLRGEPGGQALRVFYVPGSRASFSPDAPEYAAQVQKDLAVNVLRAGVWGSYCHLPLAVLPLRQVEHAYVNTLTHGDLSSLRWIESDLRLTAEQPLPSGTDLCRVHYASLNFHDIMIATGNLSPDAMPESLARQECIMGLEFSGLSSRGTRVMGMVQSRGFATSVMCNEAFLWPVPEAWSLEEAATVPVAYATAYYALVVRGRMRRGEAVLVHAGAGGVGQAAIAIALHAGCTVFTTASTPTKRAFLLTRFSALHPENIGNSRDTSFEQMVMRRTRGRGVDLVLNSLAHDKLLASARCLADGGRFLELGKLDVSENTPLGMSFFINNTTFHGILLNALFEADDNDADRTTVVRCVSEGIASGAVRPLPVTIFTDRQLENAFRYMASGRHIGKVMVCVCEEGITKLVSAVPRSYMRSNKSYVLVGGLDDFMLELGSWLVARGSRYVVIVSNRGVRNGYQAWCLRRWLQAGVRVLLSAADISTVEGARSLLRDATKLAPIAGIFNLGAVLRDGYFDNQTEDDFCAVTKPKIDVSRSLDVASRELSPELEYFVVFSSVASGRGNPGQSNYGLANSAMERVMEQRRENGLPGLAIQWGPIGDECQENRQIGGAMPQSVASCLETVDTLLSCPYAIVASMVVANTTDKKSVEQDSTQAIVQSVANILGIKDPSAVPQTTRLTQLGIDSLMTAEIQHMLQSVYNVLLRAQDIRALTFARLRELASSADARGSSSDIAMTS